MCETVVFNYTRQGKTLAQYRSMYTFLLRNENVVLISIDTEKNIKENFKYFLNVNVQIKETDRDTFIISLNRSYFISELVANVEQLLQLAYNNKAVYITVWKRTSPAAWMIHMPLVLLSRWINNGIIYTITKKENNEKQKG